MLLKLDDEINQAVAQRNQIAFQLKELYRQVELSERSYDFQNGYITALEVIKKKEAELEKLAKPVI